MTRQYVGARYVPKVFADEHGDSQWRDNIPYEALTIVTNLGNSYTSRKPVPVGIQIDNAEYWALTGAFNQQVEEYREITENLQNAVNPIINKRYVFLGDSYDDYSGVSWIDTCANLMGFTTGDTDKYVKVARGGYGFNGTGGRWIDLIGEYSITNPETVTDIVVEGGTNDINNETSVLYSYMDAFFNYCKNRFVNLKTIHIGFNGWDNRVDNGLKSKMRKTLTDYRQYCYDNGYHYLYNIEWVTHNYANLGEENAPGNSFHPSADGARELGKHTAACIMYNTSDYKKHNTCAYVGNADIGTFANFFDIDWYLDNSKISLVIPDIVLTSHNFMSVYNPIKIADRGSGKNLVINTSTYFDINLVYMEDDVRHYRPGVMWFDKEAMYAMFYGDPILAGGQAIITANSGLICETEMN